MEGGGEGPFIFTANPSVVEHTARSHFTSYPKVPAFTTTTLHDLLSHGIFNFNGNSWRVQRSNASTEFNTRAFRSLVHNTVSLELESRLIPLLTRSAKTGSVLDLQDVLQRFALDNICNVVFKVDTGCLAGRGPASEDGDRFYCAFSLDVEALAMDQCWLRAPAPSIHSYCPCLCQNIYAVQQPQQPLLEVC